MYELYYPPNQCVQQKHTWVALAWLKSQTILYMLCMNDLIALHVKPSSTSLLIIDDSINKGTVVERKREELNNKHHKNHHYC